MKPLLFSMILLMAATPAVAQDAGWLGVTLADQREPGALIRTVDADSPAAKAGIRENDVILEFNKEPVAGVLQLTRFVRETPAGRTVEIKVRRDNREQTLQVTMESRANDFGRRSGVQFLSPDASMFRNDIIRQFPQSFSFRTSSSPAGIRVDSLTDQLRTFFGVQGNNGVLVASVEPGSGAEKAGLKAGDVIVTVDGETIDSTSEFTREMQRAGNSIALRIVRDKQEREITIQITTPGTGAR
jgi:serine protease Do